MATILGRTPVVTLLVNLFYTTNIHDVIMAVKYALKHHTWQLGIAYRTEARPLNLCCHGYGVCASAHESVSTEFQLLNY